MRAMKLARDANAMPSALWQRSGGGDAGPVPAQVIPSVSATQGGGRIFAGRVNTPCAGNLPRVPGADGILYFDIQEIHPTDGWQVPANERDEVLSTQSRRARMAAVCMLNLKFEMPMLLDNMENEVDLKYADFAVAEG